MGDNIKRHLVMIASLTPEVTRFKVPDHDRSDARCDRNGSVHDCNSHQSIWLVFELYPGLRLIRVIHVIVM